MTEFEKAYLILDARRALNRVREARSRDEEYHDLRHPTALGCGHRALLRFVPAPGGYRAELEVWLHPSTTEPDDEALALALVINTRAKFELRRSPRGTIILEEVS